MKLEKKQWQYVILGALVVFVVGWVIVGLVRPNKPQTKTPESAQLAAGPSQTVESGTPAQTASGSEQPELGLPPGALAPLARRDPFLVPRQPRLVDTRMVRRPPVIVRRNSTVNPFDPYGGSALPPMGGGPSVRMGSPVVTADEPNVVLSGIVRGPRNMAVLRVNGKPYMVCQGDTFNGRYKLVTVLRESVMVERNGITKRVSLGGKSNDN